jgi:hypothetical protein
MAPASPAERKPACMAASVQRRRKRGPFAPNYGQRSPGRPTDAGRSSSFGLMTQIGAS